MPSKAQIPHHTSVHVASGDRSLVEGLDALCRECDRGVRLTSSAAPADGDWDLICLDERAPGALAWLESRRAAGRKSGVFWMTTEPRRAERALVAGADDLLSLPLWPAEARARLARHFELVRAKRELAVGSDFLESSEVQIAAYMAQLEASQENLRELYDELEAHTTDLQKLLTAQELLTPLAPPRETVQRLTEALGRLFPEAALELELAAGTAQSVEHPPREVDSSPSGAWTRARLRLTSGEECLGALELAAPRGSTYPRRKLDLLEIFAAHASQALHRSRLYEALSLGKAEWETTFDTITDSISIIRPDYTIGRANRGLSRLLGKEPRELIGLACYAALHGRTEICPNCPVELAYRTGENVIVESEAFHTNRTFDYYAYPLKDAQGRIKGVLAYARDITREEQLKKGLRQSEKLMTLGQIAAGIAHEINNPLTAVSSYAQLLSLHLTEPKSIESAHRIQNGIERIHRLVRNLMSFARPSDETFYPLDLNEIISDTLSFSRYDLTRGDTRLDQDLEAPLPKILGAKDQLEHLLVNLLTNARDAVAGRGTITVRTRALPAQVELSVEDDGVGIDPDDVDRIFEPFYTTKSAGKGTGLGLFIAAGIAKKHKGEIVVSSEPRRGSRFTLTFPRFAA